MKAMKRWLSLGAPALVAVVLLATALMPTWRLRLQNYVAPAHREILATVEGDVLNDGTKARVIKYRDRRGLVVEVFRETAEGASESIDRITLPDRHDGMFNVRQQVTRLAILDVDQDGKLELVAPSFDNQLVPHLNVFRYNPALARFEPVQPGPSAPEQ